MQSSKQSGNIVVVLICALLPAVTDAGQIDRESILACSKESDDARRLACYDHAVLSAGVPVKGAPPATSGASPPNQSRVAPTGSAEDEFGIDGSELAKQRRAQQAKSGAASEVRSLTAVVTEFASEARGTLVITLDNGQVWRQKTPESYFPIKVGDHVTITAGLLGSHRMVNGKRSTQVTRVK